MFLLYLPDVVKCYWYHFEIKIIEYKRTHKLVCKSCLYSRSDNNWEL